MGPVRQGPVEALSSLTASSCLSAGEVSGGIEGTGFPGLGGGSRRTTGAEALAELTEMLSLPNVRDKLSESWSSEAVFALRRAPLAANQRDKEGLWAAACYLVPEQATEKLLKNSLGFGVPPFTPHKQSAELQYMYMVRTRTNCHGEGG